MFVMYCALSWFVVVVVVAAEVFIYCISCWFLAC